MSKQFIPLNKVHGACPVCGKDDGSCRRSVEDETFIQCQTNASARKKEVINGYICVKACSGGHTASFKPYKSNFSREYITQQLQENQLRKVRQKLLDKRDRERALSVEERHKLYSEILEQLQLGELTLADLKKRGFSESQIKVSGFKSVEKWQKLNKQYPTELPGISEDGNSLAIGNSGYIVPCRDFDGHITGLQLRLHKLVDKNRYRWVSTPKTATLKIQPENENPLAVFHPIGEKFEGIAIVEGTGAKPFLVAQKLNYLTIGAAGGQWASSKQLFKKYLDQASDYFDAGEKVLTIFPDAGDVSNKNVVNRWRKVVNLLVDWGWKVRFGWWGQVSKAFGDIDELEKGQYGIIRYLSVAEFKDFCVKWGGLEEVVEINNVINYSNEERAAKAQKRLFTLEQPAEIVCDSTKKYLPDLVGKIPKSGLLALKAPKGSGKSHQIKLIKDKLCGHWEEKIVIKNIEKKESKQLSVDLFKEEKKLCNKPLMLETERVFHKGLGKKFLSINARIALGREQAQKWDFTWIEDADLEAKSEFGGAKLSSASVIENIDEIGLCWDSLGKIFERDWSNTVVVIDELELGLNHVATSSTCKDRRSKILFTLEQKIKQCLENNGLVIVADADLSDSSLDYLEAIAPGFIPFIVTHDFKGDPWEIDFYTGKRDIVLSQIEDWLEEENCEPIAVTLDNQGEAESLSNYLLKKFPYLTRTTGGLVRIDSKITQTDFGRNFVKKPNQSINELQPKILIYTPSLGVGCSIDITHFKRVYGLFFGNLEPSQARQSLARVRESVPRTVWCKERGIVAKDELNSFIPAEIKKNLFSNNNTTKDLIDLALNLARERAGNPQSDAELMPDLLAILEEMMGENGTWNNPHIDLYCNQIARRNFSLNQLAVQLRQELIEEGHRIMDTGSMDITNTGSEVSSGKEEIKLQNAFLTANADEITFEDAQEIKRSPSRTIEEEHAASKAFLQRELPEVKLNSDFVYKAVYKDNRKWLSHTKMFWWCFNQEALYFEDRKEWKAKLKQFSRGIPYIPDIKTYSLKVEAIHKSGVLDWIKPDDLHSEYSKDSQKAHVFLQTAYKHKKLIKNGLGITVKKDCSIIYLAKRLLEKVGLGLRSTKQANEGGKRIRYYKLKEELVCDPDRQAVFDSLALRWQNIQQDLAQTKEQSQKQEAQTVDQTLNNNPHSVPYTETSEDEHTSVVQSEAVVQATDEWEKPEIIADVAQMLESCDDTSMLLELRQCDIPAHIFTEAAKHLPANKRQIIKEWVVAQNNNIAS